MVVTQTAVRFLYRKPTPMASPLCTDRGTEHCTSMEKDNHSTASSLEGIVFHRTVRSTYAILLLAPSSQKEATVLRIQLSNGSTELRSWCRRMCKMGDLISIQHANWETTTETATAESSCWSSGRRLILHVDSLEDAEKKITMMTQRHWDMKECQAWQQRYLPKAHKQKQQQQPKQKRARTDNADSKASYRHGGGLGKRIQGQQVANFLVHIMMDKLKLEGLPTDQAQWVKAPATSAEAVAEALNAGSGVIDAAGGSGHVSMALSLRRILSTVVDPRANVGKLPSKDRKFYSKNMRNSMQCLPVNSTILPPFQSLRAWFGSKPDGIDTSFRHPDQEDIVEICDANHALLKECSFVVALHPDEATGAIVDLCVEQKKPFLIIPCCVFSRLFPQRRTSKGAVSTYEDLIEWLMAKGKGSIQKTVLPFEGANVALWSTF